MKKLLLVVLSVVMLVALAACGSDNNSAAGDWDKVQEAGKLVIGITDYEPMNFYAADGTLTGFDTEVAEAVCAYLGIAAEFQEIEWSNKEIELDSGTIDCLWNGMTYNAERDENMDFSHNYMYNDQVVVIRSEDVDLYKTVDDLAGANLTAESGSVGEDCITSDASLSQATYVGSSNMANAMLEVSAHTSDAAVIDSVMAFYLCGNGVYAGLTYIDDLVLVSEEYGIGFRTGSSLIDHVNEAFLSLWNDGTIQSIAAKYNLDAKLIDMSAY